MANQITAGYPRILRSTLQQTNEGLIYVPPTLQIPNTAGTGQSAHRHGLRIQSFELHNRAAAAISVGIGFRIANKFWRVGTYDGTTFTEDTADAQDIGAGDFALGVDETTDSFVVLSTIKHSWVSINVGTAEVDAGAAVDHTVEYTNFAGTGWTVVGTGASYADQFTLTNTVIDTGAREFVWAPPDNWGKITGLTGLPNGYYGWRITTAQNGAGDTAALGNAMEIGYMLPVEAVADNGTYEGEDINFWMPEADAVVAFFSTANAGNRVYVEVSVAG